MCIRDRINAERVTPEGWKHIRDGLALTNLWIRNPKAPDEAVEIIADIKTLDYLTLEGVSLTKKLVEPLHKSPITTFGYWGDFFIEEDIGTTLARIPNLRKLSLNSPSFRDEHLHGITGPPSLRTLVLPNTNNLKLTAAGVRTFQQRQPQIKLEGLSLRLLKIDKSATDSTTCLLYTSPSPRDATLSRMPSSA